jgi:ketosteroid isomerase-like protein
MRKPLAILLLACASAMPCANAGTPAGSAIEAGRMATIASAKPAIEAANAEWLPAMRAHDVDRIVKPYADGAVFVTPAGEAIRGRAAIARFYRARLGNGVRVGAGALHEDGIVAAGGLIYEWGRAHYRIARGRDKPIMASGRYLTVWQRDRSGAWRIIRNLSF